nr:hypothetical protein [Cytophagales bacterium]
MIAKNEFFIKFGEDKFIRRFYELGEVCFSDLLFYKKDKTPERGDFYENAISIENLKRGEASVEIDQKIKKILFKNLSLTNHNKHSDGYAFSVYHIDERSFKNKLVHTVDERMIEFGDSCVFIHDVGTFLVRLRKALAAKYKYHEGAIHYHDYKSADKLEINPFRKTIDFSYQHEYRFLILNADKPERVFLNLGSLSDISFIGDTIGLIRDLKIPFKP